MHELEKLKEMLCKELESFGSKGELSAGSLDTIDKLAHAVKNLCKVIEMTEEEYSSRGGSYRNSYDGSYDGGSMRYSREGSNAGGGSYARGRGRGARRDAMGRYSREDNYSRTDDLEQMVESIRSMMQDLPQDVQKDAKMFVQKLEQQMM